MGEAKRRGSYEERRRLAVKRDHKEREKRIQALAEQDQNMTLQEKVNKIADKAKRMHSYILFGGAIVYSPVGPCSSLRQEGSYK